MDNAQMQSTTDPGEVGTESRPTTLAGELERLRFAVKELKQWCLGTIAQWYESPTAQEVRSEDARTNTVTTGLTVTRTTTGVPAASIGTRILLRGESADEAPSDFAAIAAVATAVGAGAEDTDLVFNLRAAGAALAERARINSEGGLVLGGDPAGVPAQHGLYRANVVKAWLNVTVTPTLSDSFNVTSVGDGGVGIIDVTWNRDFANATYACAGGTTDGSNGFVAFGSLAAGTVTVRTGTVSAGSADAPFTAIAVGDQ